MLENDIKGPRFWASELVTKDGIHRKAAREKLSSMGREATAVLLGLLDDPRAVVRWEAALALKEIGDPDAAEALARAMKDENGDVRWVAAEALAAVGRAAIRPLLEVIKREADSFELRNAAHVAISLMRDSEDWEVLSPVFQALKDGEPAEVLVLEAADALWLLDRGAGIAV